MNWKMIKKKYPLAYDKYLEWIKDKRVYLRYSYDFFDDQEIFVTIKSPVGDIPGMNKWHSEITIKEAGTKQFFVQKEIPTTYTRRLSELLAFIEAYGILEKQLKTKMTCSPQSDPIIKLGSMEKKK